MSWRRGSIELGFVALALWICGALLRPPRHETMESRAVFF